MCEPASVLGIAIPKSVIRTSPSSSMSTFAGLRSRCRTPCACAAARPAHSWRAMSTTFSDGSRPTRRSSAARSSPSNELHREEDPALGFADVEDAAHRGMRDLPREPNFVEDALARRRAGRIDQLQRDRASRGRGRRRARHRPCRRGRSARSSDSGRRTPRPARTRGRRSSGRSRPVGRRRRGTASSDSTSCRRAASSPQASARKAARSAAGRSSAARNTSFARWCSDDIDGGRTECTTGAGRTRARASLSGSKVRIGAVPEGEEGLVRLAGLGDVSGQRRRAGEPEVRERIERRRRRLAAMIEDALELRAGRPAVLQLQVRLTAEIGGPELRRRRVIVRLDRLQQLERARRVAAPQRERRGGHRQLNPGRQRRVRESIAPVRPTGSTPRCRRHTAQARGSRARA